MKARITQITICFKQGKQKSISECTKRGTLEQMDSDDVCHSCQLRTGNYGYNLHGLTKTGKML